VPALAFWMVCLVVFIDSLGGSISAPVLPFYAKEFGCTTAEVGLLFSSFSLAQVICLPILGRLSDHFGRRAVLIGSLFGAAIGSFCQGLAPNYWCLMAARVISGGCGAVGSTANVYVSDITHEASRGQYLGYLMNANGAAFAFGPGLGGGLSRLGLNIPIEINGCACLVACLMAFSYLPESPVFVRQQLDSARMAGQQHGSTGWSSFPASVWAVCGVEFLRGMSFSAIFALYGLFANRVFGMDSLHIGYAVCVGALTLICTNVWLTHPLECVLGHIGSAALGTTTMAVGELSMAFAPNLYLSLLGMWSVYMGQAIAGCNIAAVTSMLATDENRGEVMSMQQMAQASGRVVGPIFLGHLADIHPHLPFAAAAVCVFLATGILLSISTAHERRVEDSLYDVPLLASPKPIAEEVTKEDIKELGTFLCDLLTEGGYQWHEESQREALKKALKCYFPPLVFDARTGLAEETVPPVFAAAAKDVGAVGGATPFGTPNPNMRPVTSVGAECNFTGDDSNFLRSPMLGRTASFNRRPFQRTGRPHRVGA